jgi:hypothetical protein
MKLLFIVLFLSAIVVIAREDGKTSEVIYFHFYPMIKNNKENV